MNWWLKAAWIKGGGFLATAVCVAPIVWGVDVGGVDGLAVGGIAGLCLGVATGALWGDTGHNRYLPPRPVHQKSLPGRKLTLQESIKNLENSVSTPISDMILDAEEDAYKAEGMLSPKEQIRQAMDRQVKELEQREFKAQMAKTAKLRTEAEEHLWLWEYQSSKGHCQKCGVRATQYEIDQYWSMKPCYLCRPSVVEQYKALNQFLSDWSDL